MHLICWNFLWHLMLFYSVSIQPSKDDKLANTKLPHPSLFNWRADQNRIRMNLRFFAYTLNDWSKQHPAWILGFFAYTLSWVRGPAKGGTTWQVSLTHPRKTRRSLLIWYHQKLCPSFPIPFVVPINQFNWKKASQKVMDERILPPAYFQYSYLVYTHLLRLITPSGLQPPHI